MSDHSVPDTVSVSNFDYYSSLLRRHGRYPLDLGELDEEMEEAG